MIHYLDNSATTEPSTIAVRAAEDALRIYGNPSSVHALGVEAKRLLESSRAALAECIGARRAGREYGRVVFTSSGTESNCTAILGYAEAKNRTRLGTPVIIITDGEHPSVERCAERLCEKGWQVERVPTRGGELDFDFLSRVLSENKNVALAALMLVNNETGALYDVKRAAAMIKAAHPACHVHCDAVQGFMKTKFSVTSLGVDSLTVSAHKIHAVRGAAALWLSDDTVKKKNIVPIMPGGGQEGTLRSGTENTAGIAAFAAAARDAREHFEENIIRVAALRERLLSSLPDEITIKRPAKYVEHIVNITLPRIKSETMLNFLSAKEIYVSAGSACSASSGRLSHALSAFGCTNEEIDSSLRVSLSHTNTEEDIDALLVALNDGTSTLARF